MNLLLINNNRKFIHKSPETGDFLLSKKENNNIFSEINVFIL